MNTSNLVKAIKEAEQDFEFYPTTKPMADAIKTDMDNTLHKENPSILDCGCGDGRVLSWLTNGKRYGIEKSQPLLHSLPKDVFVVGTEFFNQSLLDKRTSVIFCNPPYSSYELWAEKIILEGNSSVVYLIIPQRFSESILIENALKTRNVKAEVIGEFDFLDAERPARAKINIVRIVLSRKFSRGYGSQQKTDPFKIWFESYFAKGNSANSSTTARENALNSKENLHKKATNALVSGGDLVETLENLYLGDLDSIVRTYQKLSEIDGALLSELNVDLKMIEESLRLKIESLKDVYWNELFESFSKITSRLTHSSRQDLLKTLTEHTHVDFSKDNALAIVIWIVKHCNSYFDKQLVAIFERMSEKANIINYKSNLKTWGHEKWRYCHRPYDLEKYKLDYRIVLEGVGGLKAEPYWHNKSYNGLSENAALFLDDLRTIATNLGYDASRYPSAKTFHWDSHVKNEFMFFNALTGQAECLFTAKAFKKGTLHLQLNKRFIAKLSLEHGRLVGWLKSHAQAAEELDIPLEEAVEFYGTNLKFEGSSALKLMYQPESDKKSPNNS